MSDTSLRERTAIHPNAISRRIYDKSPGRILTALPNSARTLSTLPFDILLNMVESLEPDEVVNLQRVCRSLRDFAQSRAIWLSFATDMLNSCHPLPLQGFQRFRDISTTGLAKVVCRGRRLHHRWTQTDPRLIMPYTRISAPSYEDVVWLSPISNKYALCCTRSGRVLCWDLGKADSVAEWSSGADWEIWKCRVEFEEQMVYFAMAKRVPNGSGMDCQLMALRFPGENGMDDGNAPPFFDKLSTFCFPGQVISVYLLDPLRRYLTAYIWVDNLNQLGLYVLLDWSIPLYVYLNTGIPCDPGTLEWSCIGHDQENVVIHGEETGRAYQFFYPYSMLQTLVTRTPPLANEAHPPLIPAPRTVTAEFMQTENPFEGKFITQSSHFVRQWWPLVPHSERILRRSCTILIQTMTVPHPAPEDPPPGPNDPPPGTHLFTIAQHYFTIPIRKEQLRWWYIREPFEIVCYPHVANPDPPDEEVALVAPLAIQQAAVEWGPQPPPDEIRNEDDADADADANPDHTHNVDEPVAEALEEDPEPEPESDDLPLLPVPPPPEQLEQGVAVIPLVAIDFGCALWLEYVSFGSDELRVRYVTFPPVDLDRAANDYEGLSKETDVHTLEVPPEIDLRKVCHLGLDQAQGSIILGMRRSNVYVLRYE